MTTMSRRVRACPHRSAPEVWELITSILRADSDGRADLTAVTGVACSIIARELPSEDPIIVSGNGPQVRVYCLYGENALDDGYSEDVLGSPAAAGNWQLSFPTRSEDEPWVATELQKHGTRFTCYVSDKTLAKASAPGDSPEENGSLTIDWEEFQRG